MLKKEVISVWQKKKKSVKGSSKNAFKYIQSWKSAREADGPLDDKGIKDLLEKDMKIAKKLNKFWV